MSSVEQTDLSNVSFNGLEYADSQKANGVDFFNEAVKRGYDEKISQSHNDELLEKKLDAQHRLAEPKVKQANIDSLRALEATLQQSSESIIQSDDMKNMADLNFADELNPETHKLQNDLKLMQGAHELENLLGYKLEASKKEELLKFMSEAASLSKLSETEAVDESQKTTEESEAGVSEEQKAYSNAHKFAEKKWDDIWKMVNGEVQSTNIEEDEDVSAPVPWGAAATTLSAEGAGSAQFTDQEKVNLEHAQDAFNLVFADGGYADTAILVSAIIDGPPELIEEIKSDFAKVAALMGKGDELWDTDMITTLLSSIQQKMQDNRLKFDQEAIKLGQIEREKLSKETMNKIAEQIAKAEESEKSGKIGKIFSYIALAVMAIATVAAFATGVGAVAGAALIAAMAMMIVMTVDQEMGGELIMKPMAESIMSTFGVDEQAANWIATAIIMAIIIALSLGGGAGVGAAEGASKAAVMATRATMVAGGAASIGEGAAGISSGVQKHDAEQLRADAKELTADMLRVQQLIDDASESIQQALEELQAGHANIAAIMANNDDVKKLVGRNIKGS